MKQRLFYLLIGSVILLLIFYKLFTLSEKSQHRVSVSVSPVIQKNVDAILETIANVQAYASVDVKSMVTGPLIKLGFKEGELVQKDQILFEIDKATFIAALDQAKANLARDRATLLNNERQVTRNETLATKGYVSKQDFENVRTTAQSMQATVRADEAAVESAQLQLDYATIHAPISGKTGNITMKPGSLIKANDTTSLVTINQINPIYVVFSIPQNKLPTLVENQKQGPINIIAKISNDKTEKGTLTFIDNTVDITTGTIQLKGTFQNESQQLWPGQYVTVRLPVEHFEKSLLVPNMAILTAQKGFYVFVVDEQSIAHLRFITPGPVIGDETVVTNGLNAGDRVIVAGQLRVTDGTEVQVVTK